MAQMKSKYCFPQNNVKVIGQQFCLGEHLNGIQKISGLMILISATMLQKVSNLVMYRFFTGML